MEDLPARPREGAEGHRPQKGAAPQGDLGVVPLRRGGAGPRGEVSGELWSEEANVVRPLR